MFSTTAVQDKSFSYNRSQTPIEDLIKNMHERKRPKVAYGRVNRKLHLPVDVHQALKMLAKKQSLSISDLYDRIIYGFLEEIKHSKDPIAYLFHENNSKKTNIYLKEETFKSMRELSKRDHAPENRIIFTAIMRFAKKNLPLTG